MNDYERKDEKWSKGGRGKEKRGPWKGYRCQKTEDKEEDKEKRTAKEREEKRKEQEDQDGAEPQTRGWKISSSITIN